MVRLLSSWLAAVLLAGAVCGLAGCGGPAAGAAPTVRILNVSY